MLYGERDKKIIRRKRRKRSKGGYQLIDKRMMRGGELYSDESYF